MAGIYLHVPFCYKKCGYCDFFKTTNVDLIGRYQEVVIYELNQRAKDFSHLIKTVYVGGGSPSIMELQFYQRFIKQLYLNYGIIENPEITIEVNPDDLTPEYLSGLINLGFNRLSIGVQSFDDNDLKRMNRRHDSQQAINSIIAAERAGFSNISIDLIYGLPWGCEETTRENIEICGQLPVHHLSAYHLIFEPGTMFFKLKQQGKLHDVDESRSCNEYDIICSTAANMQMYHYEISNFCLPGYESKHNSSYWEGVPYLGIGPGSHSFTGKTRRWNKPNLKIYNSGNLSAIYVEENLSEIDIFNETLMLGLRTSRGVNMQAVENNHHSFSLKLHNRVTKWIDGGHLFIDNGFLKCKENSWMIVDAIINDLFENDI